MNREFKFRAWDKDENVMFYPVVIDYGDYSLRDLTGRWHDMINCELLQYIGLKDCNGREIYEGDILKITWGNGKIVNYKVKYLSECGYYILIDINNKEDEDIICIFDSSQIEIVGNIFETPKLAKL